MDMWQLRRLLAFIRLDLLQPLNRDRPKGREQWQVLIKANDNGGDPSTTKFNVAQVMIEVSDINDNPPVLDTVISIFMRNIA